MKILKIIGVILIIELIAIQFFPSELNQGNREVPNDVAKVYNIPQQVERSLQVSCYDCHSNATAYPWYNKIQPVAMYLENHVNDGKKHLNFSEFGGYSIDEQKKKLKEIRHEVEDGEMPLTSYTFIHKDANLSAAEKKAIIEWSKNLEASL